MDRHGRPAAQAAWQAGASAWITADQRLLDLLQSSGAPAELAVRLEQWQPPGR
jgi:hypothetical protein